ncbi:MAG: hypothetical protein RL563_2448 [Pseudomonadota bacterium]|jgi:CMP-N-acetylneuraminic acid synthetase
MKTLAFIPCRSGSKGFPHKNIARLNNKTLIEHAIFVAKKTQGIDDVFVSTDSSEYESIALHAGAESQGLRPKELSGDSTKTIDVIIHFINSIAPKRVYERIVLLQPTSPMRSPGEIKQMLDLLSNHDAAVTIQEIDEPHPFKMKILSGDHIAPLLTDSSSEIPRQKLPRVYALNGAIYAIRTSALIKHKTFLPPATFGFITPPKINIDHEHDFILLQELLRQGKVTLA